MDIPLFMGVRKNVPFGWIVYQFQLVAAGFSLPCAPTGRNNRINPVATK